MRKRLCFLMLVAAFCWPGLVMAAWEAQNSGIDKEITHICFTDSLHGWAISRTLIIHTKDGGQTWVQQTCPVPEARFLNLTTINDTTAFIVGWEGILLKTINNGQEWQALTPSHHTDYELSDICFIDKNNGWICGMSRLTWNGGGIFRTRDGGQTWNLQCEIYKENEPSRLITITFADSLHGWIAAYLSEDGMSTEDILHTSDGGKTWSKINEIYSGLKDLQAITPQILLYNYSSPLISHDGGLSTSPVRFNEQIINSRDIAMGEDKVIWIVGGVNNKDSSNVLFSPDFGTTMYKIYQQQGQFQYLTICSAGRHVWIAGKNGAIMKYTPEPTGIAPAVQPTRFVLQQNHPNPFFNSTQLNFTIQKPGYAQIVIYDLLGRRVRTLDAGSLNPGDHYLVWNKTDNHSQIVPAGVYFYRLQNADGTVSAAKKMVVMP